MLKLALICSWMVEGKIGLKCLLVETMVSPNPTRSRLSWVMLELVQEAVLSAIPWGRRVLWPGGLDQMV